jgi:hypothetical protein
MDVAVLNVGIMKQKFELVSAGPGSSHEESKLAKRVNPSIVVITLPNPGLVYGTKLGCLLEPNIGDKIGSVLKRIFGR